MSELVTGIEVVLLILLGLLTLAMAVFGRRPQWIEVIGAGVLEVVLLIQAVIAIVVMISGHATEGAMTFVLYLLASLLLLPAGIFWATAEKSRWGNVVLAVAFGSTAIVAVRMLQVWTP